MARLWKMISGTPWLVNPKRVGRQHRPRVGIKGKIMTLGKRSPWKGAVTRVNRRRRNPLGDELVALGALAGNPRRKRKEVTTMKKGKTRYRRKHQHSRYCGHNPPRRRHYRNPRVVHHYRYRAKRNPRHRRYRRNPDALAISMWRPMTWMPYALTVGAAATVTAAAPRLFFGPATTPTQAYLTQAGVAIAGGLLLPMVGLRRAHGLFWFLTGAGLIVADSIGRYAMKTFGLSAYQGAYYPPRMSGAGAYPYQYLSEGEVGAYESVPGAPAAPFDLPYGQ